jgi:hypothetical protein
MLGEVRLGQFRFGHHTTEHPLVNTLITGAAISEVEQSYVKLG